MTDPVKTGEDHDDVPEHWSSSDEEEDCEDGFSEEEEEAADQFGRVEDADWELARGDFTKMYNRSRQLAEVAGQSSSTASGSRSNVNAAVPLPAMNRSRRKVAETGGTAKSSTNGSGAGVEERSKSHEELTTLQQRFAKQIRISNTTYDPSATAGGALSANVPRKGNTGTGERRVRDKSDRSTVQQVLDPRTMLILYKMMQRGFLRQVNGVISTGKEANVYSASTFKYVTSGEMVASGQADFDEEEGMSLALKIYKTTILVFKDRDRYITGEFRFRHGYAKHNRRKMVKLWAEKEARNLKRLVGAGIRCPRPLELRDHVLVMEYLQEDDGSGENSPRLKDAEDLINTRAQEGEEDVWNDLYAELLAAMRTMFHQCRLVHADLSEYNILYHRQHLYIIDVSQSVEHDHPHAFDFLREDIAHVDEYFSKRTAVNTLGIRKTFEWIIKPATGTAVSAPSQPIFVQTPSSEQPSAHDGDRQLNTLVTLASGPFSKFEYLARPEGESEEELKEQVRKMMVDRASVAEHEGKETALQNVQDDSVFRQAYIPQTLNEVYDPERDVEKRNMNGEALIYDNVIGMQDRPVSKPMRGSSPSSDGQSSESDSESNSERGDDDKKTPRGHRHEDKDAKKERKKQVKEAARERRKTKMPKAEKKKRMRASKK
jgi:RIO kinase 1